jgi:multidrug transporter EmrE-like cation transporter
MLLSIPWFRVSLGGFIGELLLLDTATTTVAVGWAYGTFAGLAVVTIEALAFARLTITHTFHGAFYLSMSAVVSSGVVNPSSRLGAGSY